MRSAPARTFILINIDQRNDRYRTMLSADKSRPVADGWARTKRTISCGDEPNPGNKPEQFRY